MLIFKRWPGMPRRWHCWYHYKSIAQIGEHRNPFSGMSATMAAQLNLDTDVPFIIGSSDGALKTLGLVQLTLSISS